MFSPSASSAPNLGLVTIVCSWVFTAVAISAIGLLLWSQRIVGRKLGTDDHLTLVAFMISVVLVAQTTWAIMDEGLDKQLEDISESQRAAIIKVVVSL